jgi:hypothetical protein
MVPAMKQWMEGRATTMKRRRKENQVNNNKS